MARDCVDTGDQRYVPALRDFDAYLLKVEDERRSEGLPQGSVPRNEYWLEHDGGVIACSRLRLRLTPELENEGGHIGYDVRPSMRRRGYGTALLGLTLVEARALGLERVLITCDDDNVGSINVIERNGGVLTGRGVSAETGKSVRQYWIDTTKGVGDNSASSAAPLIESVRRWAELREDIFALALVGSHARGEARADSDVDLVLVCSNPQRYLSDTTWVSTFGDVTECSIEDWGQVQSLRVFYRNGPEVELGITGPGWTALPPDPGTAEVLRNGCSVLLDRDGQLARLRRIVFG
jgi:predicted acetyltransferase/predicted nucleotidyltransferase